MMDIRTKRIYDPASDEDGFRVLVDRLWPRGMTKERAQVDLWLKDTAPSTTLRKWFAHDPSKWASFKRRYFAELDVKQDALARLIEKAGQGRLTLLFAARDTDCNHAVAMKEYLLAHAPK
ncbi:DUF488 domain-containing protein [Methylomarinum sp. Ch1-1]|uniref:DUF488 domain-containing protein n=1 Tax=Methylomarinum roseum TaxID=3067653 RepID=A0AAU7NRB2_9GAMM|nr:DUF488 domain-containing protein [Methylomarinum sp. Ch1-1]MDP4520539.1 DUF488 domain-containing protein [Methylomarinum sp. Ch1-1]